MTDKKHTELITAETLAERIKYDPRYIREQLKDSVFIEGVHYIRPFGRRKILFIWEAIEQEMFRRSRTTGDAIPMAAGGVVRG